MYQLFGLHEGPDGSTLFNLPHWKKYQSMIMSAVKTVNMVCCEYTLAHLAPDVSLILACIIRFQYASDNMSKSLVKYLDICGYLLLNSLVMLIESVMHVKSQNSE